MKKILIILLITVLARTLSFSQNAYPKLKIYNNDTIILITPIQLKKANLIFENEKYYHALSLSFDTVLTLYKHREENYLLSIQIYREKEKLLKNDLNSLLLQKKFEEKKKVQEIKEIKKKYLINGGIIGSSVILLLIILLH